MLNTELIAKVNKWINEDFDDETRAQASAWLSQSNEKALSESFGPFLNFGTAGLRGKLGPGPSCMNQAVVAKTAWAIAHYLVKNNLDNGIVIGFDGRHGSRKFARLSEAILSAAGITVYSFTDYTPTPLVAYSVLKLKASAGIVVTASHNPPEYNGYKVYSGNGAQIISPVDIEIRSFIDQSPPADQVNRHANQGLIDNCDYLGDSYLNDIAYVSPGVPPAVAAGLNIVYTGLHGVGTSFIKDVFQRAGFESLFAVPAQAGVDPDFSTVKFPNPEEEGALDLALDLAEKKKADIILANDPDADRLAACIRNHEGSFMALDGNQVGVILAHYLLTQPAVNIERALVITTVVSTAMLPAMAEKMGARHAITLTGFKYIANKALELEQNENLDFIFGFEEALGSTCGTLVRDKDGISAALVMARLAASQKAMGKSVFDYLLELYREFGYFHSWQRSITLAGLKGREQIDLAMKKGRSLMREHHGALKIEKSADLLEKNNVYSDLPRADVLVFWLEGGHRVIVRPSGTEPKLKIYYEVTLAFEDYIGTGKKARKTIDRIDSAMVEALGLNTR